MFFPSFVVKKNNQTRFPIFSWQIPSTETVLHVFRVGYIYHGILLFFSHRHRAQVVNQCPRRFFNPVRREIQEKLSKHYDTSGCVLTPPPSMHWNERNGRLFAAWIGVDWLWETIRVRAAREKQYMVCLGRGGINSVANKSEKKCKKKCRAPPMPPK